MADKCGSPPQFNPRGDGDERQVAMAQKTAVVTGGNSGIGFETAKELARLGWRVIITGRDAERLSAAAQQIGDAATVRVADFASLGDVRALAAALNDEPRIDLLVNNIGISL